MSSKAHWLGAGGIVWFALVAVFAATTVAPTTAAAQGLKCTSNPLIGTWRLNKAKSHIERNNGVIAGRLVIIAPYGENGMTYVFIDDDDKRLSGREETWSVQFDAKPYPTTGGDPRLEEWQRVDCNTFEMTSLRQLVFSPDGSVKQYFPQGQVQSHSLSVVAPDGKSFTTTIQGKLGNQENLNNEILYFDRL